MVDFLDSERPGLGLCTVFLGKTQRSQCLFPSWVPVNGKLAAGGG